MPGPAPKKNVRRTNARPDWRTLPADGREGDAPEWPIGEASDADLLLWAELWRTPQSTAWFDLGWTRGVARYARLVIESEVGVANAALLSEIRQLEDRLGLSPMAMRRLQWEIGDVDTGVIEDAADNVVELFG